jgi:hypothetical protein
MRYLCAGLVAVFAAMMSAAADSSSRMAYIDAVQRAYDTIRDATGSDTSAAAAAVTILTEGTGNTQPEIVGDLKARPPLYEDARARLSALLAWLREPMDTGDPALASQRAHDILAMSRYDALRRPPTLVERFTQWLMDRITEFLRRLFGPSGGSQVPNVVYYAVGVAVVAAVAFVMLRASRGRFGRGVDLAPEGPRPPADFFAEADRLAASGDRVGAIRALCAAVAATLAGERSWEGSSLTVREIFQRAPDFAGLRPLLTPFEAAVYGGRDIDAATYARAAQVAARYRAAAEVAA